MSELEKLLNKKKEIEEQIKLEQEKIKQEKILETKKYNESITPEIKQWLLDHVSHSYSSCNHDDDSPNNGFYDSEYDICNRCALAEYFQNPYLEEKFQLVVDVRFEGIR